MASPVATLQHLHFIESPKPQFTINLRQHMKNYKFVNCWKPFKNSHN